MEGAQGLDRVPDHPIGRMLNSSDEFGPGHGEVQIQRSLKRCMGWDCIPHLMHNDVALATLNHLLCRFHVGTNIGNG